MAALPYIAAVITAAGAVGQSNAAAASQKYNAQVAEQNKQIAAAQSNAASEQQQRDSERRLGAAIAAFGASGAQLSSGSPMDVLADSARMATLDNLTLRYNYKLKGLGYANEAALNRQGAEYSTQAGYINAASSLLGGVSQGYRNSGGGTPVPKFG